MLSIDAQYYVGSIVINENGTNVPRYVMAGGGFETSEGLQIADNSIVMAHNSGFSISANKSNTYSPYMWAEYNLSHAFVSFDVDISGIECSCNAAVYFVQMPAYNSSNLPDPGQEGNYYCNSDALNGMSSYCWEMDLMEANKYALQVTPHMCSSAPGEYSASCDQPGCGTKAYNFNKTGMCPNETCVINTQEPFRYTINFNGETIVVGLFQDDAYFEFPVCYWNETYVTRMNEAFDYGMVLVGSYWGDTYETMKWLDGDTGCVGNCTGTGYAKFGNFSVTYA